MSTAIPKMIPVTSSNIQAIGYDVDGLRLFVRFKGSASGAETTWAYENVDAVTFARFVMADSVGSFFQKSIKPACTGTKVAA